MNNYLIEFRFHGYAKKYLKNLIHEVGKKFRVKGASNKKVIPHITLFGPFTTRDERKLIKTFHDTLRKYDKVPFKLKGFSNFRKRVIYVDIQPSEKMKELRKNLSNNLTNLRSFLFLKTIKAKGISDYDKHYPFHSTIAFKEIDTKFNKICEYLNRKKLPDINQHLLRVTLLKKGKILCEYDFMLRRLLNRKQALNKIVWRETIQKLKGTK